MFKVNDSVSVVNFKHIIAGWEWCVSKGKYYYQLVLMIHSRFNSDRVKFLNETWDTVN